MADSHSNHALKHPQHPGLPPLVPGIYNYCDSRCAKCRFSQRCLSHLARERFEADDSERDVIGEILREREGEPREPPEEFLQMISEANAFVEAMTPEEAEEIGREHDVLIERANADRFVVAAHNYAMTCWNIIQALQPIVAERGDPVVIEAAETIAELAGVVSSKTFRAVSGSLDSDYDPFDLEHDAHGSAKVARLAVAESKRAWTVLMEIGRATADGVPARLLRVLEEIDAGLAARFPRAMSFVRPGFDTEGR
ncbi:MAG TPA: hypothetical protein VLT86_20860 [Vicinamibacterales bacterium]|nr:hypothetical protein [Vicinamibacterales bacterium]